jgi:hypothetical protein
MRNVIALARSRASFFTFCNSFRNSCVSFTFAKLFWEKLFSAHATVAIEVATTFD